MPSSLLNIVSSSLNIVVTWEFETGARDAPHTCGLRRAEEPRRSRESSAAATEYASCLSMLSLHCSENIYVTTVHPILSFCSHFLGCGTFEVRRILKGELRMSRGDRASYLTSFGLVCLRFHCSHVVSALFFKYMSLLYSQLFSFVDTSLNVEHLMSGAS